MNYVKQIKLIYAITDITKYIPMTSIGNRIEYF